MKRLKDEWDLKTISWYVLLNIYVFTPYFGTRFTNLCFNGSQTYKQIVYIKSVILTNLQSFLQNWY